MSSVEVIVLICFFVLVVVAFLVKEQRLQDPERLDTVYVQQMRENCQIGDGPVVATLLRQSGNVYRELGDFENVSAAIAEIEKSFRRAKIDSVYIQHNSSHQFRVIRLHHAHGGKAEGKKLGGAVIVQS